MNITFINKIHIFYQSHFSTLFLHLRTKEKAFDLLRKIKNFIHRDVHFAELIR